MEGFVRDTGVLCHMTSDMFCGRLVFELAVPDDGTIVTVYHKENTVFRRVVVWRLHSSFHKDGFHVTRSR